MSGITFDSYQFNARQTAIYPDPDHNVEYPALGLAGEAGEVANKVKKIQRDHGGVLTDEVADAIAKEIGDCLWYCSALAGVIGRSLGEIAQENLDKLYERKEEGKLGGSGDDR